MRLADWVIEAVEGAAGDQMTPVQFDAIAKLIRSGDSPSRTAARMVLVAGIKPAQAARQAGCTPQALNNTLKNYREARDVILSAF